MHTLVLPAAGLHLQRWLGLFLGLSLGLMLALAPVAARADEDPPGRVGRLADFNGSVSWWDGESGEWTDAERNRPLTSGDRVSTAVSGRAELRVGSSVLRLANNTELEVLRLDDEKMVFRLHSGSLALRVRAREIAEEIEVITDEARLLPQRAGSYRFDRDDDTTLAGSWRGELRVANADGLLIGAGQRMEIYRQGRGNNTVLRTANLEMPNDGFSEWVSSEDRREERTASTRFVSPEMTGAEDLDRHGRWEQHPEYGALWLPLVVQADWAPYRHGRSTKHPGALRPSTTGGGFRGAAAGAGCRAPMCPGRFMRRRWWPGWAEAAGAFHCSWAAPPWAGCRWRHVRSIAPTTAAHRATWSV